MHVDKLDLRTIDKARFEQSNLDRRVKAAVLVDPGLAPAYDTASLKAIAIPMDFINLGGTDTIPLGVVADKLAAIAPRGTYASDLRRRRQPLARRPPCRAGRSDPERPGAQPAGSYVTSACRVKDFHGHSARWPKARRAEPDSGDAV
ncbi:MAG: hypothetical protein E5W28_02415 [Mesorhizobium sp.]|nr:MAG: hypothetical protein E5W28_02415 [Mesorhizobium sp.]